MTQTAGQPEADSPISAASRRLAQYDPGQLRRDTWTELDYHAHWLREAVRDRIDTEPPRRAVEERLATLASLERYWAFPGVARLAECDSLFRAAKFSTLAERIREITSRLAGDAYRDPPRAAVEDEEDTSPSRVRASEQERRRSPSRPYFEVLVVDGGTEQEKEEFREQLLECRSDSDPFRYRVVSVGSFEDAVIAILFNPNIQSVVLRYNYPFRSDSPHSVFQRYLGMLAAEKPERTYGHARSLTLGRLLHVMRPELDLYLITDTPMDDAADRVDRDFRRAFTRLDDFVELHLNILKGVQARFETPFFDALRRYSQKPTGVFHALPLARGKSVSHSHWIRDMGRFYGPNIFLAETSATTGGLDSLLQPHGPIKRAQEAAGRAFGAKRTYFVTNGTSTANKIVVQSLLRPGDIVLLSHDCHKSHHYALMLAGASPVYLDAYPLRDFAMYGGVTIEEIKRTLLKLRAAGKLDRVRMLLLTNCTFDGVTYDPERIMREVLAIKPDMVFLWDEAWFAFASFSPTLRRRTAMSAARRLRDSLRAPGAVTEHTAWRTQFDAEPDTDEKWLRAGLRPDPSQARVRVYATQSTHKTLTSFRQGSMIHVFDQDFERRVAGAFDDAFMTHTSTSPNYQILASLDLGRRQVELEGYEMVQRSVDLAMALRERIYEHPLLRKYFRVLRPADMIPTEHRPSGLEFYYDRQKGWSEMEEAWRSDEFTLDPTRVTVHVGASGFDGAQFRDVLIDRHDIQINKTSRNTVLFMTNIGLTRGDIGHLIESLASVARELDEKEAASSTLERSALSARVRALTGEQPALPNFSRFHRAFLPDADAIEGDIRKAFFLAYDEATTEHVPLDEAARIIDKGARELVSASFVTPYPPGFPVLVPGQVLTDDILSYLRAVDVKEIHGYKPGYGLRVFTQAAIDAALA